MTTASPWSRGDLVRWSLGMGLSGVLCLAAWWGASGQDLFEDQVGPANVAVLGLVLASIFQVVWLRAGRLAVVARRLQLMEEPSVVHVVGAAEADPTSLYVAGDGLQRYHRPSCRLAVGRRWPSRSRQSQEDMGRRPCGVCRP